MLRVYRPLVYNAAMRIMPAGATAGATRRIDGYLLLALALSLFAVAPLLGPGYFWGAHDARHSVYFLFEFDRSIQDGIIYPRWSPDINFGYGYPLFNIYSPLSTYAGEALHLMGLGFAASVKGVFAVSFILSALSMYLYARRVLRSRGAAVVAAAVYVYAPYHLADAFLRSALAESLCFVFLPLVLLGFHSLIEEPRPRTLVLAGAALAGLIASHYALALLFLPFLGLYGLAIWGWLWRRGRFAGWREMLRPLFWAIGAGLYAAALSAIVLAPAALEYQFVRTDQWAGGYYSYKDHFVYLFQFLAPTWGYGPGSVAGPDDTLPFQLGIVPLALSILSIPAIRLLRRSRRAGHALPAVSFHLAATVALAALMLGGAAPVWELLHLATFAQFPWRLLSLTTLTTALLAGVMPLVDERAGNDAAPGNRALPLAALAALAALVILGSYAYLQPEIIDAPEGVVSLAGLVRFQHDSGEMTGMTGWATRPRPIDWSPLAEVYAAGGDVTDRVMRDQLPAGAQAVTTRSTSVRQDVTVSTPQPATLAFFMSYYPGWRATVDGRAVPVTAGGDLGYVTIPVPAGEHAVVVQFGDTPPRLLGEVLTLAAAALGLALVRRP